ncbi:MAG: hypothetical protein A2W27_02865 [Deltaproteobacteria bacterium RBG_16_44_11]|nr:MAG: hypothetical protein A2W27_02865 [Deltaproteobacteria bacterium RBG_16_44_11]
MGNVVQKYDYDSFGNMSLKPHFIKQPFTFTGREFDQETGLYYYRARYYDAKAGRFITKDPIGFDGGDVNLYVYVGNNPVINTDPSGLFEVNVIEFGTRNSPTYGALVFVEGKCDQFVTVMGSSWPNPNNSNPGIAPGTYSAVYSATGHRGRTNGIRLRNGGAIPTIGPNPEQNNNWFATGINIHCGYSETSRGSAGCITLRPFTCSEVWEILTEGETGTVTLKR